MFLQLVVAVFVTAVVVSGGIFAALKIYQQKGSLGAYQTMYNSLGEKYLASNKALEDKTSELTSLKGIIEQFQKKPLVAVLNNEQFQNLGTMMVEYLDSKTKKPDQLN